jgi:site-specific DNA recombinase
MTPPRVKTLRGAPRRGPRTKVLAPAGRPKFCGYVRVSTEEQARGGVSMGDQEQKLRAYAEFAGADLLRVEVDAGLSGKDLNRPGLRRALDAVLSGEADALIVYAIDRLSRSTLDFLTVVSEITRVGRGFVSVREQMDTSTPHGRFTMTILAAMAEMEREMIRSRCREASARCRDTGRVYGRVPYGLRRSGDRLIPNEVELGVLSEMQAARAAGSTLEEIAADLNARGVPSKSGSAWYASSVRSVLNTAESLTKLMSYE